MQQETTLSPCSGQYVRLTTANHVALLELNDKYEERFGHTFLLCAPGVPAHVVEESMRSRMGNSHTHELLIAASEQAKITEGRLTKMLDLQTATETGAPPEDARAAATARVHQARRHARRRGGGGLPVFERTPRARSASDGRGRRLTAPAPRVRRLLLSKAWFGGTVGRLPSAPTPRFHKFTP